MKREKIFDERHKNREDLAGEHVLGDLGQIILLIIFLAVWISDSFFFHYSNFISKYTPFFVRIPLATIILIISGYLAKNGLNIVFGEVREKSCVIRKGVFGIVRHPIYLGVILFYLGLLTFSFSIIAAIIWIIIIAFYHFLAKHEERLLSEKYGENYVKYMEEIPMWMPRIKLNNLKSCLTKR